MALLLYLFAALTFCVLAIYYGYDRWTHPGSPRRRGIFPWFALACALAFLSNLSSQLGWFPGPAMLLWNHLVAALVPPLMLHVLAENEHLRLRTILGAAYLSSIGFALARVTESLGWWSVAWEEWLYRTPALFLGLSAAAGIAVQAVTQRNPLRSKRSHRTRLYVVLGLMLVCSIASLWNQLSLAARAPDYLLLAFFGFNLYHRERLVFFDVLVKRGVFAALGLAIAGALLGAHTAVVVALAFWITAPWIYTRLSRLVDQRWLSRPYAPDEAERLFVASLQSASNEEEMREATQKCLGDIFRARATVRLDLDSVERIRLEPRPNGVPYLSHDYRLLQTLNGALGLALENLRVRAERQHLRWLAGRAELKALRAQINPHFLFNSLSVIAGLVHSNPSLADETIEYLAEVFRYTLRKSESEWTPLADELDFVAAYLKVERARFGERLHVEMIVSEEVSNILIPAMCIQPLVENAIRHGVSRSEGAGNLRVMAALQDHQVVVEVCDDGPGFPPGFSLGSSNGSHGLANVAERLRGYYGDQAALTWRSDGQGTSVRITLPRGNR